MVPIEFKIHLQPGYFESRWTGRLTDAEIKPSYRKFFESDGWVPGLAELCDLSEVDISAVSSQSLRDLAEWSAGEYARRGVSEVACAVYAPHDLPFGLARLYGAAAAAAPESVSVFRDREQAVTWLVSRGRSDDRE